MADETENNTETTPDLTALTQPLQAALKTLTDALTAAASAVSAFAAKLNLAPPAEAPPAPTPQAPPEKAPQGAGLGGLESAATLATGALTTVGNLMRIAVSGLSASVSSAGGMLQGMGSAVAGVSQMLSGVLGPAGAAVGQALGQVVGKIGDAVNAVQPFVEALAPGTILLFQQAMQNLQATLGVAFEPIFQQMTGLFQKIGGLILPVMQELRPVIEQVSKSFSGVMIPIVEATVTAFKSLLPFIKILADVVGVWAQELKFVVAIFRLLGLALEPFRIALQVALQPFMAAFTLFGAVIDSLSEVISAVANVFEVLYDTVKALIPGLDFKDLMKKLADATNSVIKQFYLLIATIAKFFGADTFLKNLIDKLTPKQGEVAAPKNASIGSVESVAKEIATAAATASGQAETDKEATANDIVAELQKIQSGGDSKFTRIVTLMEKIVNVLSKGPGSETAEKFGYDSRTDALVDVTGAAGGSPLAALRIFNHVRNRRQ